MFNLGWPSATLNFYHMSYIDDFNRIFNQMSTPAKGLLDRIFGTNYLEQDAATTAFERQQELNEQDRQWQEFMMDKQNAYNSPAAQLQRLRAAGLNPSLMYGFNPTESAGVSSVGGSAPMAQGGRGSLTLSEILNASMTKAQIDNIRADTEKKRADAETENQLRQARYDNLVAATSNLEKQNEDIVSNIKYRAKLGELTESQIDKIKFDKMLAGNQFMLDKQRVENETKMTSAEIDKMEAEKKLTLAKAKVTNREYDEMVWTFAIRQAGLEKQVQLTEAQIEQAKATARKIGYDADMLQGRAEMEQTIRGHASEPSLRGIGAYTKYMVQSTLSTFGSFLH